MLKGDLTDIYDTARGEAALKASLDEMRDFNLSRSGQAENAGRIGTSAGQDSFSGDKRREDKKKKEFRAALNQARRIAELQETINEANDAINAGNEVLGLMRSGKLDRNNEDHIELMVLAGLDPHDENLTEDDVVRKIEEWTEIKDKAEVEQIAIDADITIKPEVKLVKQVASLDKGIDADANILMAGGVDDLFNDPDASFAGTLEPSSIATAEPLSDTFSRAHDARQYDDIQLTNEATPVIDLPNPI